MNYETIKHTLLTNIGFIQDGASGIRMDSHALLISEPTEPSDGIFGELHTLRGFGIDGAWPVFTYWLDAEKQLPFTLHSASDPTKIFISDDGTERPLFGGTVLTLKDGRQFFLQADAPERPLDVHTQTGSIGDIWDMLAQKTAEYWHAPCMPALQWVTPGRRLSVMRR